METNSNIQLPGQNNLEGLLLNLQKTREIIERNVQANYKLDYLKNELTKTNILIKYSVFGIIFGLVLASVTINALNRSHEHSYELSFWDIVPLIVIGVSIYVFKKIGRAKEEAVIKKRFDKRMHQIVTLNSIIVKTYEDCEQLSVLPEKYRTIQAIDKIIGYLSNKRADSLKEALNLYEDEMLKIQHLNTLNNISRHQEVMIEQQQSIIKEQKAMRRQLTWHSIWK